jgi:phthiocerol/phenolphthiocerol synthesis type-I polyketide synthase D
MPTIDGSVSRYLELAKILGRDRRVYGIHIVDQAQTGKLGAYASLRGMAASVTAELLTHHRDGPICLVGASFGGCLALEVARQLVGQGKLVHFVGMIDTMPGRACFTLADRLYHFAKNVGPWAVNLVPWLLNIATREITDAKHRVNFRKMILRKLREQHDWGGDWYKNLPEIRRHTVDRNRIHSRKYRFEGSYCGTIFLFRCTRAVLYDSLLLPIQLDDYGWRRVTRANVHVVYISGDHDSCMSQPDVVDLANELSLALSVAISDSERGRVHK